MEVDCGRVIKHVLALESERFGAKARQFLGAKGDPGRDVWHMRGIDMCNSMDCVLCFSFVCVCGAHLSVGGRAWVLGSILVQHVCEKGIWT